MFQISGKKKYDTKSHLRIYDRHKAKSFVVSIDKQIHL